MRNENVNEPQNQQSCQNAVMPRTCNTCGHKDGSKCNLGGFQIETERKYPTLCGLDFHGWIPKPQKIGLKKRLLSFWYGA